MIKPILLSLKRQKFMSILMIVQIAFTMGVLSSSVFVSTQTLSEWNLPSGIPHQDIVRISPEFFDENQDVGQALAHDLERVRQQSRVVDIAPSNAVPFTAENVVKGYLSAEEDAQVFDMVVVESDEHIFDVLGLSLIDGRKFTAAEVVKGHYETTPAQAGIVMISEELAQVMFPNESALGKTLWLSKAADPVQIIGVYSNFMTGERLNGQGKSYHSLIRPQVKWSYTQQPHYLIRVEAGLGEAMLEDLVSLFYQEQGRYVNSAELLKRTQKRMYDGRGSRALTFLVLSFILVIITAFGITGLTSFQITQKKKQIGTRRALGAKKRDIIAYFITENSIITLVGLLIGVAVTLTITFEMSEQSGRNFLNISVMLITALFLWLVNVLAVYFPAKRAANIAPAIVTRSA